MFRNATTANKSLGRGRTRFSSHTSLAPRPQRVLRSQTPIEERVLATSSRRRTSARLSVKRNQRTPLVAPVQASRARKVVPEGPSVCSSNPQASFRVQAGVQGTSPRSRQQLWTALLPDLVDVELENMLKPVAREDGPVSGLLRDAYRYTQDTLYRWVFEAARMDARFGVAGSEGTRHGRTELERLQMFCTCFTKRHLADNKEFKCIPENTKELEATMAKIITDQLVHVLNPEKAFRPKTDKTPSWMLEEYNGTKEMLRENVLFTARLKGMFRDAGDDEDDEDVWGTPEGRAQRTRLLEMCACAVQRQLGHDQRFLDLPEDQDDFEDRQEIGGGLC